MKTQLPPGWTERPLSDVVEVLDAERVPVNAAEREVRTAGEAAANLVPYYGATGQAGFIDDYLFDEPLVLLGEDGVPFFDRARSKAYQVSGKSWVNNHAHVLRCKDWLVDPRYLVMYLNAFDYQGYVSGSTRAKLTQTAMMKIPVRVPPLAEQGRIVAALESYDLRLQAAETGLDRAAVILSGVRQGILDSATSGQLTREWREARGATDGTQSFPYKDAQVMERFQFPISWTTARLEDIAQISSGITKDSAKQLPEFQEVPYLRVANVQRGYLDLREVKTIRVRPDRIDDLRLRDGDILFNEGGDLDKLGRGWVWSGELPLCVYQNHVFRARLARADYEPKYFSWYGNSRGHAFFLTSGKQTTNLASISRAVLASLPVAVPPPEEQREIVRLVERLLDCVDQSAALIVRARSKIINIRLMLQTLAIGGVLVPQLAGEQVVDEAPAAPMPSPRGHGGSRKKRTKEALVRRSVDTVLREAGDWLPAEELFRRCGAGPGASTDLVESIYHELAGLARAGRLERDPTRDAKGRKVDERLRVAGGDDAS